MLNLAILQFMMVRYIQKYIYIYIYEFNNLFFSTDIIFIHSIFFSFFLSFFSAIENTELNRSVSRAFLSEDGLPQPIEFFLASDASAIVEHTKQVLYLEDDDIAHIANGGT